MIDNECSELRIRLALVERKLRLIWFVSVLQAAGLAIGVSIALFTPRVTADSPIPNVMRTRGLIIEDEQGRPRILIGAPVPQVAERIRKNGQTAAMILLGENGADRLIVGEAPDPAGGGNRIAQGVGVLVHDPKGHERAGFGFLGDSRAAFVLDRMNGDAVGAMVDDKTNFAGFIVNYPTRRTGIEIGTKEAEAFLRVSDQREKPRLVLSVARDGQPSLLANDVNGREQLDVLRSMPRQ